MTLMFLSPLSGIAPAPPVPTSILESQESQSFCSLLMMVILALEREIVAPHH